MSDGTHGAIERPEVMPQYLHVTEDEAKRLSYALVMAERCFDTGATILTDDPLLARVVLGFGEMYAAEPTAHELLRKLHKVVTRYAEQGL
jgi:hypothetical protein